MSEVAGQEAKAAGAAAGGARVPTRRRSLLESVAWLVAFAALNGGGLVAWQLSSRAPSDGEGVAEVLAPHLQGLAQVALPDVPFALRGSIVDDALRRWHDERLELRAGGLSRSVSRRLLGAELLPQSDWQGAARLARQGTSLRPGSVAVRWGSEERQLLVWVGLRERSLRPLLSWFARRLSRDEVAPRWDFARQRAQAGVQAQRLDELAARDALHAALVDGLAQVELPLVPGPVPLDLTGFAPSVRIANFATPYNPNKRDRVNNLMLAANALDGLVLAPGASLSYNAVVGERSEARGFLDAPVIEQGEVVEGVGGGACQVSSTLYAAALFAGLDLVERYPHTLPSSYIKKGFDATVSWPDLDLVVRNPYTFPVALRLVFRDERLNAELWAPQAITPVAIRWELVAELPYEDVVTVDPLLPKDTILLVANGKLGFKVSRARIFREAAGERFERLSTDVYPPRSRKITVGPETWYDPVTLLPLPGPPELPPP